MWRRVRYRKLQAVALLLLAALVTISACVGPLYQRATEQALAAHTIRQAQVSERSVKLTSFVSMSALTGSLPDSIRSQMGTPVTSASVSITMSTPKGDAAAGRLYGPSDGCAHVQIVKGRCPKAPDEVMISSFEESALAWPVGQPVDTTQSVDAFTTAKAQSHDLTIVGVYTPKNDGWLGTPTTGRAGFPMGPRDPTLQTDDWITTTATVNSSQWAQVENSVVWELRTDIGVDALLKVGPRVASYANEESQTEPPVRVDTGISDLAGQVVTERHEGRVTVVALVLQLVVLAVIVLWLLLGAATEQRRSEVALGRLRGQGAWGAARFLLAELIPLVLIGAVIGGLLSAGLVRLAARAVLSEPVPFEVPVSFLLAWLAAAVVSVLVVLAAVARVVREPVATLLRSVPPRVSARSAGAAEVVMVTACLTATIAFLTGTLSGPLAVAAPTLFALAAGIVLGRLLVPLTTRFGSALLRHGHPAGGIALLQLARRPATRRLLTLTVVASCLLVFSADALAVASRNRERAAQQEVGASLIAQMPASTFFALDDVANTVRKLDPDRRLMTPVVSVTAPGAEQAPTVAVDPVAFSRVAFFPGVNAGALDWSSIEASNAPPLHVKARELSGTVNSDLSFRGLSKENGAATLQLHFNVTGDNPGVVDLAKLRPHQGSMPFDLPIQCHTGCDVTGIGLETSPALQITGTIQLSGLHISGLGTTPADIDVGPAKDWVTGTDTSGASLTPQGSDPSSLTVVVDSRGSAPPLLSRTWVPQVVPALTTSGSGSFTAVGLDGADQKMKSIGNLPRVPGSPPDAHVVDLQNLLRQGKVPTDNLVLQVWFKHDDRVMEKRLAEALKPLHVPVTYTYSVGQAREKLDDTPAAWSLELAGLVGGAALLFGLLVLLVLITATWRSRSADLAALRMSGVRSRVLSLVTVLEQLSVLVAGVLLGAACGVLGAHFALPSVRQFTHKPIVPTTDFAPPWLVVAIATGVTLALLGGLGWAAGQATARSARLTRVREVQ